jgi:beta-mannosidase
LADKIDPDAEASTALVALLPGETATVDIAYTTPIDPRRFLANGVFVTANSLVAQPPAAVIRS